jgi:hypothetical protein
MAIRPLGGTFREVLGLFAAPSLVGLVGVVGVYFALQQVPYLQTHFIAQAIAMCLCSGLACLGLYRLLAPKELDLVLHYARKTIRRGR